MFFWKYLTFDFGVETPFRRNSICMLWLWLHIITRYRVILLKNGLFTAESPLLYQH